MGWEAYLPLIFCWAVALVALVSLGFSIWSLSWPRVKGFVEVSFLDAETGWTRTGGTFHQKNTETHQLAYSYEVAGVKYLGANIKPWGVSDWTLRSGGDDSDSGQILWSGARDTAKWYRPGVIVDVYYCPARPQWSCLEPGGFIVPTLVGGVAIFVYFAFVR